MKNLLTLTLFLMMSFVIAEVAAKPKVIWEKYTLGCYTYTQVTVVWDDGTSSVWIKAENNCVYSSLSVSQNADEFYEFFEDVYSDPAYRSSSRNLTEPYDTDGLPSSMIAAIDTADTMKLRVLIAPNIEIIDMVVYPVPVGATLNIDLDWAYSHHQIVGNAPYKVDLINNATSITYNIANTTVSSLPITNAYSISSIPAGNYTLIVKIADFTLTRSITIS